MQWPTGGKSDGGQLPLVPVEAIQDVFSFWACSGFGQVNGFVVLPKPFLAQEGVRSHFGSSASAGLRRPQEAHRSLLECGRRRFHWRPQTKAHCGGPLYVDYDEFPNCGGIWFEGRDYDSRKAPVLGPCGKRWHAADDSHFTMSQIDMDPPPELLASWRRLGWGRRR